MIRHGIGKIRSRLFWACCCAIVLLAASLPAFCDTQKRTRPGGPKVVQLPEPNLSSSVSLEQAISSRRSARYFIDKPLDFVQIGQLAWAGQGITDKQHNLRAAPSAGDLYPIELYFVTAEGAFVYRPEGHTLEQVTQSDPRKQLSKAAQDQGAVADAPCDIVIIGSMKKLAAKYGNKAEKFMLLEAGHIAENIQLQAVTLGLASVPVGTFDVKSVSKACELRGDTQPLLMVCVGFPLVQEKSQGESRTGEGIKNALLIVPAVNFKDEELIETQRTLTGAGIQSVIASSKIGTLQGEVGGIAASETTLDKINVQDYDALVFIGGPGAVEYFNNAAVLGIVREAAARNKVIAAIDIAPTILANAGVLRGVRATGFLPQRDQMLKAGAQYTGAPIERDGTIITASDPSVVMTFAQVIVSAINEKQSTPGKTH